ncbi:EutP/PduV family microcompartment system protein [uncultured Fusobacterium sp.]|uniref:EutP/PduV family microcompartment system protein n=1 Tax=uncultured Fusobacterium sp. TaxID=159267 RepID=UPI002804A135|nr:EutP/PduV family microcompartment system protein [uncultured Fusobacterium sp.]
MKVMLLGKIGCGKTTLTQRLNEQDVVYAKTQAVSYENNIIDTPGEYIENKFFFRALLVTAAEAEKIIFVQSADEETNFFPPNFKSMFLGKDVIGVITKIDKVSDYSRAEEILRESGVEEILYISKTDNEGLEKLKERLEM